MKAEEMERLVGIRIGGCRLEALIGHGAMGAVFRGVQESLDRPVAVKVLRFAPLNREASAERFFREARATARVNHPNVVQVYDAGRDGEIPYIVMELVAGHGLGQRLRREKRLALRAAIEVAIGAARGLDAAHRVGLIHRDVKPDNILIAADGTPKLVDFGLTKDLEDSAEMTRDGHLLGTPNYMSPEACAGEALDPRSDLYSLGVTLFAALAGRLPFESKTMHGLLMKHLNARPPRLREIDPAIPPSVEALVARLLEKDPSDRFPSAARLLEELLRVRRLLGAESDAGSGRVPPPLPDAPLPLAAEAPPEAALDAAGPVEQAGDPDGDLLAPRHAEEPEEAGPPDTEDVSGPPAPPPRTERTHVLVRDAGSGSSEDDGLTSAELLLRAKIHYVRQDWEHAEKDLERAIALDPANGAAQFALACVLARARQDERALAHLERAIAAGFRERQKIVAAHDLARLAAEPRFKAALARI